MKTIASLFAIACLSFAGFTGCAESPAPSTDPAGVDVSAETTVVRYSPADIAALKSGELLRLDLTVPNTVYAVTYTDPASLGRVLVIQADDQYLLSGRAPAKADSTTLTQIVLSGDQVVDTGSGASVAPPAAGDEPVGTAQEAERGTASCKCPCCIVIGGDTLVCC
jgi:hypothetical protein